MSWVEANGGGWRWVEMDGATLRMKLAVWRWIELGGGGWRWVEVEVNWVEVETNWVKMDGAG